MAVGGRGAAVVGVLAVMLAACGRYDAAGPAPEAAPGGVEVTTEHTAADGGRAAPRPGAGSRSKPQDRPGGAVGAGALLPDAPAPGAPLPEGGGPAVPVLPADPRRAAVVVGIDDYPGKGDDLVAAAADARLVRRALERVGFGEIVVLVNGRATRPAILWSARWLARRTGPGDLGAFFYAGHIRQVPGDPDGDGEDVDEALQGADGRLIFDGEMAGALSGATGPLWLAWAGCYAAGFSDAAAPGRVSSYASDENSLAYESAALGQSFMVEYLVRRALLRNGLTRVEAMHGYAWRHLRGEDRRFRPLLDDRLPGPLPLAPPPRPPQEPRPEPSPHAQECLVVLRCSDHG